MPGYARPTQVILSTEVITVPTGDIAASQLQAALSEISSEKATVSSVSSLTAQTVRVYDTSAARSSAIPAPTEGMVTYLKDQKTINVFNGTAWIEVSGGANPLFLAGT
jgi:hypothetical protein